MSDEAAAPISTGEAAAALLATGLGCAALGILALAADASPAINHALAFYFPSGALSGVTTVAILAWLAAWAILGARWRGRAISLRATGLATAALVAVGLLLTFPPTMDALQGK